jgi:type VI secretion system secreted protein VgrG
MADNPNQFHIELEFRCEGVGGRLHVADFTLTEALSETYRASVDLHVRDAHVATQMLGRNALLTIRRGGGERFVQGIVTRTEHGGVIANDDGNNALVRVQLEPALCALKHTRDSRIFQAASAVDIVREVLAPLATYGRQFDLGKLKGTYPLREYTVQFDESDFDFAARLAAEEGITFYFDHSGRFDSHAYEKLVFADENTGFVRFQSIDGDEVVSMSAAIGDDADAERIFGFWRADELGPTGSAVRDYDWTHPEDGAMKDESLAGTDRQDRQRAIHASIGETTIGGYQEGPAKYSEFDIVARGKVLQQRIHNRDETYVGEGVVTGFMPGHKLKLEDHSLDGFSDREYLITSITHYGGVSAARGNSTDRYRNAFTAFRVAGPEGAPPPVPYRPPLTTPWPRIHSVQTARVVGLEAAGSEITTDDYGRVKVQFHWDRLGTRTDRSSCFIRVAQQWAGRGYGFLFIPRIGHEVIVSFIEGNPDRPIIIGSVYNGENMTENHPLPASETRSVIRTKTFGKDASQHYNELSFNDAPDNEEILIHASRDFNETVVKDHNTKVDGKQSNTVKLSHSESVGGSQSLSVGGNRTVTITGSENVTIKGEADGDDVTGGKMHVTGDYKLETTKTVHMKAPDSIKLECGGSTIMIEPGKITVTAGDGSSMTLDVNSLIQSSQGTKVMLDSNALMQSSGSSQILLDANALTQSSGGSSMLLDANALARSSGGSEVLLDANAKVAASGGGQLVLDANATMSGAEATVSGQMSAQLDSTGNVKADPTGVTVMGTMIKLN